MKIRSLKKKFMPVICLVGILVTGCSKSDTEMQSHQLVIESNYYQMQSANYANRGWWFKQPNLYNLDSIIVNYQKALEYSNKSIEYLEKAKSLDSVRYTKEYNKRKGGLGPGGDEYRKHIQEIVDKYVLKNLE